MNVDLYLQDHFSGSSLSFFLEISELISQEKDPDAFAGKVGRITFYFRLSYPLMRIPDRHQFIREVKSFFEVCVEILNSSSSIGTFVYPKLKFRISSSFYQYRCARDLFGVLGLKASMP